MFGAVDMLEVEGRRGEETEERREEREETGEERRGRRCDDLSVGRWQLRV